LEAAPGKIFKYSEDHANGENEFHGSDELLKIDHIDDRNPISSAFIKPI